MQSGLKCCGLNGALFRGFRLARLLYTGGIVGSSPHYPGEPGLELILL